MADLWAENFPLSYLHYLGPALTPLTGAGRMALFLDSGSARTVFVARDGGSGAVQDIYQAMQAAEVPVG